MRAVLLIVALALVAFTSVQVQGMQTKLRVRAEAEQPAPGLLWDRETKQWVDPLAPTPANMTIPDLNLVKPIIHVSKEQRLRMKRADAPLRGPVPANLTKAPISKNLYGGVIEFKKGTTRRGCPCKLTVREKFRYDHEYKPEQTKPKRRCGCKGRRKNKKPKLPPVLPEYYPTKKNNRFSRYKNGKNRKNCRKPKVKKQKIAPEYYPKKNRKAKRAARLAALKNCKKLKKRKTKVVPEYYPSKKLTREERKAERLRAKGINPYTPAPATPKAA